MRSVNGHESALLLEHVNSDESYDSTDSLIDRNFFIVDWSDRLIIKHNRREKEPISINFFEFVFRWD